MKYLALPCLIFFLLCACNEKQTEAENVEEQPVFVPAAPGTVVAADSERIYLPEIAEELYFTVKVKAGERTKYGTYTVEAEWGYNYAKNEFTLPEGGEYLKPEIRKTDWPYSYIIGFRYGADSAFYDYYLVEGHRHTMEMKYIKAYTFR